MMRTAPCPVFVAVFVVLFALVPQVALADGPLTNGATHTGVIQPGGLDTWTIAANRNDTIVVSIGEIEGSGSDPDFVPWIRLRGPNGSTLDDEFGNNTADVEVRTTLTGIYTVLVAGRSQFQDRPGSYALTVVKTPGPYSITPGDEGGIMTDAFPHAGAIEVGDVDTWTFQAAQNDDIALSVGEVAGSGGDSDFVPWIRLLAPDGSKLDDEFGNNIAEIDVRAPLTGTYTVLVAGRSQFQDGSGIYNLTGSGLSSTGPAIAAILPVAGSTQGSGAFFRTSIQIHNPRSTPISGTFVYHRAGVSGGTNDPSLAYTLNPGQTIEYADLLPAMGVPNGLGSIDIRTAGDPLPILAARIFSDAGVNGTAGFFLEPVTPESALRAGDSGVIIAPADPLQARLNLGIRSLDSGASLSITVRNKSGALRATAARNYAANFFEQVGANGFLGATLEGSDTITFTVSSGQAIIYGAQTDNRTQDPSVQYAKKTF
jgi:desulfoferrodoxin (superoxide reductase-like protein)